MFFKHHYLALALTLLATLTGACATQKRAISPKPGDPVVRRGDEIIACGQLFHTGTPVVTWLDEGGYDAYRPHCTNDPERVLPKRPAAGCNTPNRLSLGRTVATPTTTTATPTPHNQWSLSQLQDHVDLFVIHYDVAWTSANCFRIIHDVRGLSVHFMLDLDGTIYQACDLKERARHAGLANDRSIGIEIAHPGPVSSRRSLAKAYKTDAKGLYLEIPANVRRGALKSDFRPRPARTEPLTGTIQGSEVVLYDYTPEQYAALTKLTQTLARVFPKIRLDFPRNPDGSLINHVLTEAELAAFQGILGHYHITDRKIDPGPFFEYWDPAPRWSPSSPSAQDVPH